MTPSSVFLTNYHKGYVFSPPPPFPLFNLLPLALPPRPCPHTVLGPSCGSPGPESQGYPGGTGSLYRGDNTRTAPPPPKTQGSAIKKTTIT